MKGKKKRSAKFSNILRYIINVACRTVKTFFDTTRACYAIVLSFFILNAILGVGVGFNYYFTVGFHMSWISGIILFLFRFKSIFAKPAKANRRRVPTQTSRNSERTSARRTDRRTQRTVQRKRRRVS